MPRHRRAESVSLTFRRFFTHLCVRGFAVLAAIAMAARSSADEPKLKDRIVVPIGVGRNYQPAAFPKQPIDAELRVGIVPPSFDRGRNASWTVPASWIGPSFPLEPIPKENILEVNLVFLSAADSLAQTLPALIRRLFPRSEVLREDDCTHCDLTFITRVESESIADSGNRLAGVTVTISMTAVTREGVTVASISGVGTNRRTKSIYWSTHTEARGIGEPALRQAVDRLFADLIQNPALRSFIQDKAAARARPSDLQTRVAFDDAGSYLPNGRLDAGEAALLRFRIENRGPGPAYAVRLRAAPTAKTVLLPRETEVGDIEPGGVKEVEVPLSASVEVETAQHELRVDTVEKRGYGGRPLIVQFATERLERPSLEIADIRLEDRSGDGDGRPANGETLDAVILIRNRGPGAAVGAALTIAYTTGVELVDAATAVGFIAANAVKEVRTRFRLPITFGGSEVGLTVRGAESRGAFVATVDGERRWPVRMKRPQVEVGFRLFDGNSPQSRGNRDGIANNGETLEVALLPVNRGTLAARGVRLTLASPIGLVATPASIVVGDLPALAEGGEQRVQINVPRGLGGDAPLGKLPLTVTVAQADFPSGEQMIGLPFTSHRPELFASLANDSALIEGKPAVLSLAIRNHGPLAAEDVKVEVRSDNAAVELLDASGAPGRAVDVAVGSIPSRTVTGPIELKAHVKRNPPAAVASLVVSISQRDFAPVVARTSLTILGEEPAVISAVPPESPSRSATRASNAQATISFQRHSNDSRVRGESVSLAFEVQSPTLLELVRLEQNHRAVELPDIAPTRIRETYLWQFEPHVFLDYGSNEFEVVVITSEGVRSSRSITIHREAPAGRIWLAVIGISNYRDPSIADLDFARNDAVAVGAYYRDLGIPSEQIIELFDERATLADIKRRLGTELVREATNPEDTVLIYFAGHGEMEADRSSADSDGFSKYLLPHDANRADLFGSALSMEELSRILERLRAERVVLIIDSCFSGAAGGRTPYEPNLGSRGVITEEFLSRIVQGKGRVILTASGGREVALESRERRHGIFTYFLLEGLRGAADTDRDGRVDVDEIYKFVSRRVSSATGGRQNPMRKSPNLTGTLVLGGRLQ